MAANSMPPNRRVVVKIIHVTAAAVGIFATVCTAAQADSIEPFVPGTSEWSFSVGYGQNWNTDSISGNVSEDIEFYPLLIAWNRSFYLFNGGSSLAYAFEAFLSYVRQEGEGRYLAGITPFLVYNFNAYKKLIPYVELGLGIAVTNLDPEGFGGDFGFTPQAGIGVRYAISNRQFLRLSYRFHHISNAGLKDRNKSIDTNFLLIGYSFRY